MGFRFNFVKRKIPLEDKDDDIMVMPTFIGPIPFPIKSKKRRRK